MQEEVENRSVTLAISATKLSARVLRSAIAKLLAEWQKSRDAPEKIPHGKQTVKELVGQNQGVSNIEVTDGNIISSTSLMRPSSVRSFGTAFRNRESVPQGKHRRELTSSTS